MKKLIRHIFIGLSGLLLFSCTGGKTTSDNISSVIIPTDSLSMITPVHARGFNVSYMEDMTLLDINDPENKEAEQFHFALVGKDFNGSLPEGYTRLNIPIETAICMTSLQLSNFLKLGIPEKVVGITSTRHLHNEQMNQQLKTGKTHKIGIEGNFDNEVIMAINPDIIFISPFKRGGYDAIRDVDIPMLPHLGYK
ncbi:MAG: iron ABC transporter substrate-binding protein, partial [Muribaculaceae bacterium]|nr:iron ABC transporter substrate-binding protein [Muribaculaceae bacterium]